MAHPTLTIALLFAAQAANANPAAEKLFQDGRTALTNKEVDKACDAFRASEELEPRVGTLLNLGDCEELRKRVASAWNVFIDAKDLAAKVHDERGATAARRAKALEARLPYVTLAVKRVPGLVVQRDGAEVAIAEWDHEIPIDPRAYELTASAPGYKPWSTRIDVVEGQHLHVDVPELVKELVAVVEVNTHTDQTNRPLQMTTIVPVRHPRPTVPYHIGVGVLTGTDTDTDWINGARIVLDAAPLGDGVIRVVPQLMYASTGGPLGQDEVLKTYAIGVTLEYAYPITDRLLAAGGLGTGFDMVNDSYNGTTNHGWGCLRLSPTFTFDRLNIGLHYQLVRTSERFVSLFEAGIDFFVW
ncbi:MAG TPA: hypothetical protein VF403_05010 [Kofleriaceae bacterium]